MKRITIIGGYWRAWRMALLPFAAAGALFGVSGCAMITRGVSQQAPQQTQLQTRQYQTREYDTANAKLIMKAVLNVLQDDGFIVKNAVVDLGLLSATKEIDISQSGRTPSATGGDDFWSALFDALVKGGKHSGSAVAPRVAKFKIIETTVNVSEYGKSTRVRASFQGKILDERGDTMELYPVDDEKFYQEFFAKVDKGVFLQKQKL